MVFFSIGLSRCHDLDHRFDKLTQLIFFLLPYVFAMLTRINFFFIFNWLKIKLHYFSFFLKKQVYFQVIVDSFFFKKKTWSFYYYCLFILFY
jgi:hypothetical protein